MAKETKLFTVLNFENSKKVVDDYFTLISAEKENSVRICNEFFNLPTFSEMHSIIDNNV